MARSWQGQGKVKTRSRQSQRKAKERSRQGQGKVKATELPKNNLNRKYNLMGFDTSEINLVLWSIHDT